MSRFSTITLKPRDLAKITYRHLWILIFSIERDHRKRFTRDLDLDSRTFVQVLCAISQLEVRDDDVVTRERMTGCWLISAITDLSRLSYLVELTCFKVRYFLSVPKAFSIARFGALKQLKVPLDLNRRLKKRSNFSTTLGCIVESKIQSMTHTQCTHSVYSDCYFMSIWGPEWIPLITEAPS